MRKVKLYPVEIQSLMLHCHMNTPVSWGWIEELKAKYPEYWNNIGQFDPYFKRRNRILNYFRRLYIDYKISKQCKIEDKIWRA